MTQIERDLSALGFADITTAGEKVFALRWIEGGTGLYVDIKVDGWKVTWEHEREFRGDAGLAEAKGALHLWKLTQAAAAKAQQVADLD